MSESTDISFELTSDLLQPVVVRLLGDESVVIDQFEIIALKPGAGNPTSLGVYRVRGTCRTDSSEGLEFSVVVKHLGDGAPVIDSSDPGSWNYWRREIALFESPLVERIPAHIRYPKYLGQSLLADGTALFWNGDLGDLEKTKWTWDQCLQATKLAADLNAIDTTGFEKLDWLNRNQVAGWGVFEKEWLDPFLEPLRAHADADAVKAAKLDKIWPYYVDRSIMERTLSEGRHAFTHTDFNLNNLMPSNGEIIVLDWQLAGTGRIGADAASIFNTAFELDVIDANREQFEELCATYTTRFNEVSSEPISLDEVRLAVAMTGLFILRWMSFYAEHVPAMAEERGLDFESLLNRITSGPLGVYVEVLGELGI